MRKVTCVVWLVLALTVAAYAADQVSNLSSVALEHLGLNVVPEEVAPPYAPPASVQDVISWTTEPNCLNTINRAACGKIGNFVYIFGGQGSGGGATHVAFNITTEQWVLSTAPGVSGSNWSSAVANGMLYLFPTSFGNGEVQVFTPTGGGPTGVWSLVALYPGSIASQAVAWDGGNYIYCAGGSPFTTEVYRLNLTTNTFDLMAPLPEARAYVGGAFVNGKFYVLGGDNASYQYTNTCYEYTPATNTWVVKAPLIIPNAFSCFNTVTDGQKIYLVGGGGGNATTLPSTDTVQVYDPALNAWSIETNRMNNYGTNSAAYVPEGNFILDVGGRIMTTSYNVTWRGNLLGGGAPDLDVTITPHNPPIVIPPGGGSFQYDFEVENTTVNPITFDVWIMAHLPNGNTFTILVRQNLTLPGGTSIVHNNMTQNVPGGARAGNYLFVASAGTFPISPLDSDTLTFTKQAVGSPSSWGWESYGWEEPQVATVVPKGFQVTATPNPFNPTTTIGFTLPAATRVTLQVYDINGRSIATLANGWREIGTHQVSFDGANLPTGLYFCRLQAGGITVVQKLMLLK